MCKVKLLVAEDDADIRGLITHVLTAAGYETEAVDGGRAALARAAHDAPRLLIVDVHMPDLDGVEVCRRVTQSARPAAVMLISSETSDETVGAGYAAGAVDYLAKPFSTRELVRRVEAALHAARDTAPAGTDAANTVPANTVPATLPNVNTDTVTPPDTATEPR